jgi:hypothetical protein
VPLRATPIVPHPKLSLLFFGKNRKPSLRFSHLRLSFIPKWETDSARVYMHATIRGHPSVSEEVEGYENNFVFLRIYVSIFQEVEGYKHNFVSLSGFTM